MSEFSKLHSDHCSNTGGSSADVQQWPHTHGSSTVPPTPGVTGLPPVVVGACVSSKRSKKRLVEGLHLGSLPSQAATTSALPFANQAFNPFFSNIRQNMELSHGSIKERFPVRLPKHVRFVPETGCTLVSHGAPSGEGAEMRGHHEGVQLPAWLRRVIDPHQGPEYTAETYEVFLLCIQVC